MKIGGPHEAALLVPFGGMVAVAADGSGDGFDPGGIEDGRVACEETSGVDEFAGHDPGGGFRSLLLGVGFVRIDDGGALFAEFQFLRQHGTRMKGEAESVGAAVVAFLGIVPANAAEESGEE